MKNKRRFTLFALGLLAAGIASAQAVRTERQVRDLLHDEGYLDISGIELDGGTWQALASDELGREVEVRVDPSTGRVYSITRETLPMSETELRIALRESGYTGIHDVRFDRDDRIWKAEAYDVDGEDVELEVDALSGRIVFVEED